MTTLAEATLDLARVIYAVLESTATGGSTTTLVDSSLAAVYSDDHWNQGTIWFLSGALAGKTAVITDYTGSTGTFTFATQTSAVANGISYAVISKFYPRYVLRQAINRVIQSVGMLPATDETLVSVADQEVYTLPAGVSNVKRVYVSYETEEPYNWLRSLHWEEINGELIFDTYAQPNEDDLPIKLVYMVQQDTLDADTDTIDDQIHIDRLTWAAAVHALRWKLPKIDDEDQSFTVQLQHAQAMDLAMQRKHKIPKITRDPRLAGWSL